MNEPYTGNDPNYTPEWWALNCSAPAKIERARAKTRAIREGQARSERAPSKETAKELTCRVFGPVPHGWNIGFLAS